MLKNNNENNADLKDQLGGINGQLPTHAYVHLASSSHLAAFAPALRFVVSRQRIRPQTANAHSLGR